MNYKHWNNQPNQQVAGAWDNQWNNGQGFPKHCAPQVSPTQQGPSQVSPTQQYVNTNVSNTEINHVHPSHTTNVNKHMTTHKHYFPHTESVVNDIQEQHIMCGKPHNPCPPPCGPKKPFGW
ncbi:CotD family spore coat protein [Cytobacillus purgationiresistens]|uniref:Inner spore coat protein D n=1 Tax=Cytobacillus purgationiresistens TaxID=863449 RepID=A0ABU0ALN8_9BACI|nr:CotD family spore coat protein [Cytobacillus purgationiresistens]MDQ0271656.1 hypothetical protein [Cytobacillus purgationiresistens]